MGIFYQIKPLESHVRLGSLEGGNTKKKKRLQIKWVLVSDNRLSGRFYLTHSPIIIRSVISVERKSMYPRKIITDTLEVCVRKTVVRDQDPTKIS